MLIEIDDAGVGCPIGGIVIAAKKGEKFVHRVCPLTYFRNEEMRNGLKSKVRDIVKELLEELDYNPKEDVIKICQGDIFSTTREWFEEKGYKYESSQIRARLQEYVETAFDLHLTTLGVPRALLKMFKEYKDYSFHLFKWAVINKEKREKYVKTTFPSWKKRWNSARIKMREVVLKRSTFCIECGERIAAGDKAVKIDIFIQDGRKYVAFAHEDCIQNIKGDKNESQGSY